MSLLAPHNLPFLIAFGALAVIAVLQVTGVSEAIEGAGEFDSPDGLEMGGFGDALTTLLGLGRVPLLIWLAALLFVFATVGVIGQSVLASMLGAPLSAGWAALAAGGRRYGIARAVYPAAGGNPADQSGGRLGLSYRGQPISHAPAGVSRATDSQPECQSGAVQHALAAG